MGDNSGDNGPLPCSTRSITRNRTGRSPASQYGFEPAALEIQERPPSPTGRMLAWLLIALFSIGLLWAMLGKVDIVVTAPGRIVPSGQVKVVQAPESASVSAIHVAEGDQVRRGQALISLDATYASADDSRILAQLSHARGELNWRRRLEQWLVEVAASGAIDAVSNPIEHSPATDSTDLFAHHADEIAMRTQGLASELLAARAQRKALQLEEQRSRATLAILAERVEAYRVLVANQHGAKVQYLELLQQQTDLERTLPVLRAQQWKSTENAAAIKSRITSILRQARRDNAVAITDLSRELDGLAQESRKAKRRERLLHITAPVAGTVQELTLHTHGAVVTPAQALLKIVPVGAPVEVEAMLMNKDIGFVHEGQRAEVKVDAFNFTKYGLLEATIVNISDDAVQDETLGWVFKMRLALGSNTLSVQGKDLQLSSGMAVATEVKTGQRRLIEFFLAPLLRYRQESLRER